MCISFMLTEMDYHMPFSSYISHKSWYLLIVLFKQSKSMEIGPMKIN